MITIAVIPEKKTYYMKMNEDYTINGVSQIQNNSTESIRISENPQNGENKGWVLHSGRIMGFSGATTIYLRTPKSRNIEFEME